MRAHEINELNNFISGWYLDDVSICDELINFHKQSPDKRLGVSSIGYDKTLKDSVDVTLLNASIELKNSYFMSLQKVANLYSDQYKELNRIGKWASNSECIIQYYPKNGAFFNWHTERTSAQEHEVSRVLVFMTYLNDVQNGGQTEFLYQNLKVKPEKGLTLFWPSEWTHTHRGIPAPFEEKWIITGWFNFIK
jgi:hypothetical protein